ncbi:MAG: tetratricopeptide repeat protein, partial [Candidatus Eisenbacteria bacterium]|nr:tetratricopeptide repeat protein [Candidatus Eisenbacteria bacterium]
PAVPAAPTSPGEACRYPLPMLFGANSCGPELAPLLKGAARRAEEADWIGTLDLLSPTLDEEAESHALPAGLHYLAGRALHEIGQPDAAREHLEAAAYLAPDQPAVWIDLARSHLTADAPRYAYRAARRALQLSAADHRAHYVLGRALLELKRGDEALEAFARATEICGGDADVWNAIGLVWLYRGELAAARTALETAVACASPPAYAHNNLGVVYERLGLYEWADREYARCLQRDPDHPTAARSRNRIAPFMAVRPWVGQSRLR